MVRLRHRDDRVVDRARVAAAALRYVAIFEIDFETFNPLWSYAATADDLIVSIGIAGLCCDARFSADCSFQVAEIGITNIVRTDQRKGAGYLKGAQRGRALLAEPEDDEQWSLHRLYVAVCCGDLQINGAAIEALNSGSDVQLMLRLCSAAQANSLQRHDAVLNRCIEQVHGVPGIPARFLPFLRLVLENRHNELPVTGWIRDVLKRTGHKMIADRVVRKHLERRLQYLQD